MAKVNTRELNAVLDEDRELNNALVSDELDREHREWDGHGEDWEEFNHVEEPDEWFYDEPHYDWESVHYDPFPMCDDFYD